jgi:hypothetical protein
MSHFLYKLISPRSTFPQDMTRMEMKVMREHLTYWKGLTDKNFVVIFGPVADPNGIYGLAIVEADDGAVVNDFGINDPAIKAYLGFRFEVFPMLQSILREKNYL